MRGRLLTSLALIGAIATAAAVTNFVQEPDTAPRTPSAATTPAADGRNRPKAQLDQPCTDAVDELRDLMDQYPHALALGADAAATLNNLSAAAVERCSPEQWELFNRDELNPWLTATYPQP